MGVANSKIEEDKALVLCRERKRFVRQALDERCSLAVAHASYVQSLRHVGFAFTKFVDPEDAIASSWNVPTSSTTKPRVLTDQPITKTSDSSYSLSRRAEETESYSPVPSSLSSGRFHVNHMKAENSTYLTVHEKAPTSVTATLHTSSSTRGYVLSESDNSSFDASATPRAPSWDYFSLPHPVDNQLPFENGRGLSHDFDNADDIRSLNEEVSKPDLEGDRIFTGKNFDIESEDDFDQPSNESLVRMFSNRNLVSQQLERDSTTIQFTQDIDSITKYKNGDDMKLKNGSHEIDETPERTAKEVAPYVASTNGKIKESIPKDHCKTRDFFSCMKEIEILFAKASESGNEVARMLEADKVKFQPSFPEQKAHSSAASIFLTSFLACCRDEKPHPHVSATNEVNYITWHGSASSLSSSSENFHGPKTIDGSNERNGDLFKSTFMNSGSHASTLDRLYAWEKKLYDEVKASGTIRREYDMKCRLLRHKESTEQKRATKDKARVVVKDLHSRILVAIQRIDSISKKIEEIRDKELQPQLEELIEGLTKMWRMMLDYHSRQHNIILLVANNGSTKVSIQSKSEDQATVLEFELNSLSSNFSEWMSAHKSYLQAINGWLLKCVLLSQKRNKRSKRKQQPFCPKRDIAPPIFVTCQDWLSLLDALPTKEVASAIHDLVAVTTHLFPRQEKGHGASKLSFSLSRKAALNDELEQPQRSGFVNRSINCDNLQLALTEFLHKLKIFAESSVSMYEALQNSIKDARDSYERSEFRM